MSAEAGPIPLASQVGGHPGLLTTEDGSLVIKVIPSALTRYSRSRSLNNS
jgi:1D-myo-inositol-tetrakisphosphate 5-kinase/inositol-polyphosphate multikinase